MSLIKKTHDKITSPYLKTLLLRVDDFLDLHYRFRCEKRYKGWIGRLRALSDREEAEKQEHASSGEHWWEEPEIYYSDPHAAEVFKDYISQAQKDHLNDNFSVYLMRLIEAKGLDAVQVYKRANIDRKLFSKIKTNPDYIPSKKTVLALAIALELGLDETQALLKKAGFTLSNSILSDVIIEFFITHGKYDLDEINAALYAYDQSIF